MTLNRLIQKEVSGTWQVKGISWEELRAGETITEEIRQRLYGCLCKLKDYEDSGMNPDQAQSLPHEASAAAEQVCDDICRYRQGAETQEELDAVCGLCPVSRFLGHIYKGAGPLREGVQ